MSGDWTPHGPDDLASGEIHVWRVALDAPEASMAALGAALSGEERERAERFRFERHRRRFVVRRAALREILAAYTGCAAARLAFEGGPNEKPRLAPASGDVTFSLAHSREVALLAVAREQTLGVDVERIDPDADVASLGQRVAAAGEQKILAASSPTERIERFFWLWCLKEAYVKAQGVGLDRSLQTLTLDAPWWHAGEDVRVRDLEHPERRWWARPLGGLPECAAALVSVRPPTRVRCRTWTGSPGA